MIKGRINFKVNPKELRKEILQSSTRMNTKSRVQSSLKTANNNLLIKEFGVMKEKMVKDFLSHPVTREILAGPKASNISGTLGGYGNLFSFIGFESGTNPIQPIVDLLDQTKYDIGRIHMGNITINVEIPSKEQIFKATPLPWAPGISWAERIEIGLSGLGQYLNTASDFSRSGQGIQSSKVQKGGSFKNTKYISDFINRWHKKFLSVASNVNRF